MRCPCSDTVQETGSIQRGASGEGLALSQTFVLSIPAIVFIAFTSRPQAITVISNTDEAVIRPENSQNMFIICKEGSTFYLESRATVGVIISKFEQM